MGASKSKPNLDNTLSQQQETPLEKVLILGSAQSGKSTFLRSIQRITTKNFDEDKFQNNLQQTCFWVIEQISKLMDSEKEEQLNKIVSELNSEGLERLQNESTNASLLVKLWKYPFFREAYELKWGKDQLVYENVEELVQRIERKKIFDPMTLINLRTYVIVDYQTTWKDMNVEFLDVLGKRNGRRNRMYCFENIKLVIFTVSLSEFNLVDENNIGLMNESLERIVEVFGNGYISDARKVIIFTKPDILVKKLQKRIEYYRKINLVVRPELEIISNDYNERIVTNSIVSEYLEKTSMYLYSYHIVNVTSEDEVKSVIELIFDNSTTPFISPCLLPIANRMITTLHNIYLRKLLTDIQIITTTNELSP